MVRTVSKRLAVTAVAVISVAFLGACATGPGGSAGATAENPANTSDLARGWDLPPETGIEAGPRSVRGAHKQVVAASPGNGEIETADIPGPGQGSDLAGNPARQSTPDPVAAAEIIVRSLKK